ncbi:MAG: GNAT family N-acetyltransferase [Candidatus Limnocylindria bacterium]
MRPPLTVRDATPADAPAIARVARASWQDTYRDIFEPAFIEDFLARAYDEAALARTAERAVESDDEHFLVAERDGEIVGYLGFGVGPRGPELSRVYADPTQYGTGIGTALLEGLHRRIDGQVESYVLDVHSRNERGRAFYDRNGFVMVGGGATADCDLTLRRTLHPPRPALPVETERLRLRSLTPADAERLHDIYGDAETMRFVGASGRPMADIAGTRRGLERLARHHELHGFGLWAVDERNGEPLVGVAGLAWVDDHGPDVEAAYLFRRDRWGRGYATEALRAILELGRSQLGLARIVALAYPGNDASRRVMEKAGMRPDGTVVAYGREMSRHMFERAPGRD